MPTYSIASGSYDGRLRVYDIRMGRTTVDVLAHPVTSVRCSTDGHAVLASTLDGRIRMLDRSDGRLLQAFGKEKEIVGGEREEKSSFMLGQPGSLVYRNSELRIRSVFAKADAVVLSGGEAEKVSGNSAAGGQAAVFAWDVLSGEIIAAVPAGPGVKAVSAVAWNEKGGCWAGGCSDGMFPFSVVQLFFCRLFYFINLSRAFRETTRQSCGISFTHQSLSQAPLKSIASPREKKLRMVVGEI